MFHTRLCDLLGIKYPIIQGGMAWVATAELVAAVSNAGALGVLGGAVYPAPKLKEEIRKIRDLTDKPFGVNLMPFEEIIMPQIEVICEEKVPVLTTGLGDPQKIIKIPKEAGVKVIPVVPNVRHAVRLEKEGADGIIAEGTEGGGHVGDVATLPLIPQVVDQVSVPVVAAGGIGDARGFISALALGADGVQMGTRFVATKEAFCHKNYKEKIINANEVDTVITGRFTGFPMRVIKNKMTEEWLRKEEEKVDKRELLLFGAGKLYSAAREGDVEYGSVPAGQICGLINDIKSAKEVIENIIEEAIEICEKLYNLSIK